jgi:hypothetical protein
MKQITPQSWGLVFWSGGAGKPGEMGGWRFRCNFCNEGNVHTAFARKHAADAYLGNHCMEKHRHKTEVRALMTRTPTRKRLQSTTGAADGDAAPLQRNFCSCGKQRPCFDHGLDFEEDYDGTLAE